MSPSASLRTLPRRPKDLHKGRAGVTLVVGGSCRGEERMAGAPALAACGAFRAGCGLVRVLTPEPLAVPVLQMMPSATATALAVDAEGLLLASAAAEVMDRHLIHAAAMVIGPGMADDDATGSLALRAVQQEQVPAVVDAGAISALARVPSLTKDFRGRVILTPHPGEFRRLAEPLRIGADPVVPATRLAACEQMAQRLGCIVVLKGAGTVVSDGLKSWTCTRGHPCLATAGTGDVLAGVIGGLIAQYGPEPHDPLLEAARARAGVAKGEEALSLFDLACIGVEAHAMAGERWAAERGASGGLLAMELGALIPACVEACRG
ncbi:MAG: hypothetical protein RL689_2606 [Planctomycetota bacterium]|jgi:NAD(P)H-hydrate epimerase